MIHYYIQKGFSPDYLINLSYLEKAFFVASMQISQKEKERYLL